MVLREAKNDQVDYDEEYLALALMPLSDSESFPDANGNGASIFPMPFFAFGDSDENDEDDMDEEEFDDMDEEEFDDDDDEFDEDDEDEDDEDDYDDDDDFEYDDDDFEYGEE